ncbi:MAG: class I SAM-dependent methyltransferase [Candidatus Pacebacteria bacterium]|nr:class I SAM-dependent methyltransferase [Candidatus Paceibacterota bacterium]
MREKLLALLWYIPFLRPLVRKRLPKHGRGYSHYWTSPEGAAYRLAMYERQKDMDKNPSFDEMRTTIAAHKPATVLCAGCGYGREMAALASHFSIEGFDIAQDLLDKAPKNLRVFKHDLLQDRPAGQWDVVFCRAVLMYFPKSDEMRSAMQNLETMARTKVIVWEWPHIIADMKAAYPSAKFEYHPLAYRKE